MVGNYKINNEEFLKELSIKRPNIEALEKYHGVDGKIKCKCRICDYEFETTPYVLLSSNKGNGCRKCNGTVTKTHEEYLQEIKEKSLNIIPIENTIKTTRYIENLHNLIKNNGKNFDVSDEEIELAKKL